jgi:hypothetical protein
VATESLSTPSLSFDAWKLQLHQDCENEGKVKAFDAIGDYVLRVLWQSGIDPTVRAVSGPKQD